MHPRHHHYFVPHIVVMAAISALTSVGFFLYSIIAEKPILAEAATYGDVSTFVGKIYTGDGGDKLEAYFDFPEDLDVDAGGNFYFPDTFNNVIRKIDSSGIVSTIAGTGSTGDADGAALSAQFYGPRGIAVDSSGNVYVSDTGNNKVKKISGGVVTTLVSSDLVTPLGLEVIGGTLYIADSGNNAIKSVSTGGGTLTVVASSGLSDPRRFVASQDGSLLYLADNGSHRVLSVNVSTGVVSVIAGSGNPAYAEGTGTGASFENVWGVARSGNNLYVSDMDLGVIDRIRKINLSTQATTLLYQDQYQAEMIFPAGLVVYNGYVYVMNAGLGTIHQFNKDDGTDNERFAGKDRFGNAVGTKETAIIGRPNDLAITSDRKTIYFSMNNMVRKIDRETGEVTHVLGVVVDNYRGEGTDAEFVRFSGVTSIAVTNDGKKLYLTDRWNNRIRGIDLAATPPKSFLVTGAGLINTNGTQDNGYQEGKNCGDVRTTGQATCSYFKNPMGIVLDPDEQFVYVTDTGNNRIRKVRLHDGQTFLVAGTGIAGFADGTALTAQFNKPSTLAIDSTGKTLYVADTNNQRIRKIDLENGTVSTLIGNGTVGYRDAIGTAAVVSYPEYIEMGSDGILYFSEAGSHLVRQVDPKSKLTKLVAGSQTRGFKNGAQAEAEFNGLRGITVDVTGKTLYVSDAYNDMIRSIDITGVAPHTDPAPAVAAVSPQEINPLWDKGSGLQVEIKGKNFKYGAKTLFADISALKTSVQSSTSLSVKVPHSKMKPGWYDVTVINLDAQVSTLERGLGITNTITQTPNKTYAYSKKTKATTSGGADIVAGSSFFAFNEKTKGGFFASSGDVTGDGIEEIVMGSGNDQTSEIRIFSKDLKLKTKIAPYGKAKSGARIAVCNVVGDSVKEIITVPGPKTKPEVKIYKGNGKAATKSFLAIDKKFSGGLNVSCGDVDGNGTNEIIITTSADKGSNHQVWIYTGAGKLYAKFDAFAKSFKGGIRLATGDLNKDKKEEIIVASETGAPQVLAFSIVSKKAKKYASFSPFSKALSKGSSIASGDLDGDGTKEIIVGGGTGSAPLVKVFTGKGKQKKEFYVYSSRFRGGVNVAASDVDSDGLDDITATPMGGGTPNTRVIKGITLK